MPNSPRLRPQSAASKPRGALFLDRDGTIIEDAGYLHDPEQVRLLPGAAEALRRAAGHFLLYLFTNQSGIGRGYYDLADAEACNARLLALLQLPHPGFTRICIAPETPDAPQVYRKPSPRFITETLATDPLDPSACWMIGDRLSDVEAGIQAGIRSALVWTSDATEPSELLAFRTKHDIPRYEGLASCIDSCISAL